VIDKRGDIWLKAASLCYTYKYQMFSPVGIAMSNFFLSRLLGKVARMILAEPNSKRNTAEF